MKHLHFFLITLLLSFASLHAQAVRFTPLNISLGADADDVFIGQLLAREFGLNKDFSLQKTTERKSPTARYLTFDQSFDGKALHDAGIKVCIDQQGKLLWAMDFLQKNINIPAGKPGWKFSEQAVRFRLLRQFGTLDVQLERMYHVSSSDSKLTPIWRCWTFSHGQSESWEVLIHAETGVELERSDRAAYHNHQTAGDTTGRARIWSPNPVTASGSPYGALFADNNDMASSAFEPYIDTVVLEGLTYEGGLFKLEGPFVKIKDLSANIAPPVTSSNGDFFFTRDTSGWEDVIVYYHIDHFQRYIQSLGFTNLWGEKPLNADPHGRGNNDNSSFIPNGDNSSVGFGEGGVDDAEDADVVIHEYGHALSYAGSPNSNTGTERRGLDEGFGDYFAALYSFDKTAGGYGWSDIMNWDGHNPFWAGRYANKTDVYSANMGNIYVIGELWSSTMMEIRQQIGADTTDRLQFETLYGLVPGMSVADAARLVIAADWMYYSGRHEQLLRNVFCSRQILTGSDCIVSANETEIFPASWSVIAKGGDLHIFWLQEPAVWEAQLFDNQGKRLFNLSEKTSVSGLASGVYVVRMMVKGEMISAKKVVL
ncbi:MAG: M36 family metallopeptidase [Bacteroidia bacterium]